jgi:hypothetical protein
MGAVAMEKKPEESTCCGTKKNQTDEGKTGGRKKVDGTQLWWKTEHISFF